MNKIGRSLRISPSSLDTFFKCSMQYKWTVIDELVPDEATDNLYAILGTTFHKIMELHDRFKFSINELKMFWKPLFCSYFSDALYLPEELLRLGNKHNDFEAFLNRGDDLINNGIELKERWKKFKIIRNEFYFRLPFPNQFLSDVALSGRIDLVLYDPEDGTYVILDWKTSKHIDENIDNNIQLTFYIYYIHKTYNVPYEKIYACLAYPVSKQVLFSQREEKHVTNLFDRIKLALKRISENDFSKEPKMTFQMDNCTFCPHKEKCSN